MSAPLRIGTVGYGSIGRHHARNLAAFDDVTFVGVVEADDAARAEAAEAGHPTFETVDELVAAGIDAACVCTPTALHAPMAAELAAHDVALLVEKPLASDVASAKYLIALMRRRGLPLMVGYVERYNPAIAALRAFLAAGNLGPIISIAARRVGVLPPRIKDANVLVDIGVHDIDAIAYLTSGPVTLISAQGGMAYLRDRLDYALLALDAGGVVASVLTNWVTPVKIRDLALTGTNGYVHVDYITQKVRFAPGREFEPAETFREVVAQHRDGDWIDLPVEHDEPLRRELRAFVGGLRGGDIPSPEIALESLRIAEEATKAIDERLRVVPMTAKAQRAAAH